jgi:predicted AAA+ superfamily ATPase
MEALYEISNKLIRSVSTDFRRGLYSKINWKQRLIEIKGSRGVGKTTLMLQKAKELFAISPQAVIYITLEDIYFFNHSIVETAEIFNKYGGKYLFIDEVHKYPSKYKNVDWSAELKTIYDLYPELSVVYSGSSIIELYKGNGDLSRRKSVYNLIGLSFREYLTFNHVLIREETSLENILAHHVEISTEITDKLKILPHFKSYIRHGYYPFYNEEPDQYYQRIKNVINLILEVDIPSITDITFETIGKMKKMLLALSTSVPYTPNLTQLSANLNVSDLRTLYKYFNYLEQSELIMMLHSESIGNKLFQKPEKLFLNNTNIISALFGDNSNIGTVRETFFCNQLNYTHEVNYPKIGDFLIDRNIVVEIGGKNKSKKQIKDVEKSYLAVDEIEIGFANKIPLWLFGFLY